MKPREAKKKLETTETTNRPKQTRISERNATTIASKIKATSSCSATNKRKPATTTTTTTARRHLSLVRSCCFERIEQSSLLHEASEEALSIEKPEQHQEQRGLKGKYKKIATKTETTTTETRRALIIKFLINTNYSANER